MQIGPYTLASPYLLAPMAGVSEMPFRTLVCELGAGGAPTELVSAKGLIYGSTRTEHYLARGSNETPFWVQLFGGDAESMAQGASRAVELGAEIIDLNMGCPVKKVTRGGGGSALLRDLHNLERVATAVCKHVGVPVTAKIRAGWDATDLNFIDVVRVLANTGCVAVTLHARTQSQSYGTPATWEWIKRLVEVSAIPVIGNGDALTANSARRMMRETGCAGVMIGRGACGNPWIFRALRDNTSGVPSANERWELVRRHFESHLAFVGDEQTGLRRFRPHFGWYSHGLHGANEFRRRVMSLDDRAELLTVAAAFFTQTAADAECLP